MSTSHPFRFGITLLGAASKQEWIARVHQVEDLGYSVLRSLRPFGLGPPESSNPLKAFIP